MQVQAQKLGAILLTAQVQQGAGSVLVTQAVQIINTATTIQIRNGFNIEYQYVHP